MSGRGGGKNATPSAHVRSSAHHYCDPWSEWGSGGVEVRGEGSGGQRGRIGGSGVGGWESEGGRLVGVGRGSDPTYLQSHNKHTRNNQCKIIVGNIILCPVGPFFF